MVAGAARGGEGGEFLRRHSKQLMLDAAVLVLVLVVVVMLVVCVGGEGGETPTPTPPISPTYVRGSAQVFAHAAFLSLRTSLTSLTPLAQHSCHYPQRCVRFLLSLQGAKHALEHGNLLVAGSWFVVDVPIVISLQREPGWEMGNSSDLPSTGGGGASSLGGSSTAVEPVPQLPVESLAGPSSFAWRVPASFVCASSSFV
eukprot:CAMPEP_0119309366 /NCGR_PEP_ID=MMETSP1333-20130426/15145_2 /TAXON_ID=418940 /ORGANISM="Scyphosphaera apsteinii, Strain RCC1455" /LENGTH=199 /DNA_ID=CAMNT_0007313321 /DNA_START=42 /DNA_END=642 /DNA_ORIENTATION=-